MGSSSPDFIVQTPSSCFGRSRPEDPPSASRCATPGRYALVRHRLGIRCETADVRVRAATACRTPGPLFRCRVTRQAARVGPRSRAQAYRRPQGPSARRTSRGYLPSPGRPTRRSRYADDASQTSPSRRLASSNGSSRPSSRSESPLITARMNSRSCWADSNSERP
jgi:hypothetical protein